MADGRSDGGGRLITTGPYCAFTHTVIPMCVCTRNNNLRRDEQRSLDNEKLQSTIIAAFDTLSLSYLIYYLICVCIIKADGYR
jgi:hypothetical protein